MWKRQPLVVLKPKQHHQLTIFVRNWRTVVPTSSGVNCHTIISSPVITMPTKGILWVSDMNPHPTVCQEFGSQEFAPCHRSWWSSSYQIQAPSQKHTCPSPKCWLFQSTCHRKSLIQQNSGWTSRSQGQIPRLFIVVWFEGSIPVATCSDIDDQFCQQMCITTLWEATQLC